jgi:hypothetical protein
MFLFYCFLSSMYIEIRSHMVYNLILFISNELCVPIPSLDEGLENTQQVRYKSYEITNHCMEILFMTCLPPYTCFFVRTIKSCYFNFVNKLHKIDVSFRHHNQHGGSAVRQVTFLTLYVIIKISAMSNIHRIKA